MSSKDKITVTLKGGTPWGFRVFGQEDETLTIVEITKGSHADTQGLQEKDVVVSINGVDVQQNLPEALKLSEAAGDVITLEVVRGSPESKPQERKEDSKNVSPIDNSDAGAESHKATNDSGHSEPSLTLTTSVEDPTSETFEAAETDLILTAVVDDVDSSTFSIDAEASSPPPLFTITTSVDEEAAQEDEELKPSILTSADITVEDVQVELTEATVTNGAFLESEATEAVQQFSETSLSTSSDIVKDEADVSTSIGQFNDTAIIATEDASNDSTIIATAEITNDKTIIATEDTSNDSTIIATEEITYDKTIIATEDTSNDSTIITTEEITNDKTIITTEEITNDTTVIATEETRNDTIIIATEDTTNDTTIIATEESTNVTPITTTEDTTETSLTATVAIADETSIFAPESTTGEISIPTTEAKNDETVISATKAVTDEKVITTTEATTDETSAIDSLATTAETSITAPVATIDKAAVNAPVAATDEAAIIAPEATTDEAAIIAPVAIVDGASIIMPIATTDKTAITAPVATIDEATITASVATIDEAAITAPVTITDETFIIVPPVAESEETSVTAAKAATDKTSAIAHVATSDKSSITAPVATTAQTTIPESVATTDHTFTTAPVAKTDKTIISVPVATTSKTSIVSSLSTFDTASISAPSTINDETIILTPKTNDRPSKYTPFTTIDVKQLLAPYTSRDPITTSIRRHDRASSTPAEVLSSWTPHKYEDRTLVLEQQYRPSDTGRISTVISKRVTTTTTTKKPIAQSPFSNVLHPAVRGKMFGDNVAQSFVRDSSPSFHVIMPSVQTYSYKVDHPTIYKTSYVRAEPASPTPLGNNEQQTVPTSSIKFLPTSNNSQQIYPNVLQQTSTSKNQRLVLSPDAHTQKSFIAPHGPSSGLPTNRPQLQPWTGGIASSYSTGNLSSPATPTLFRPTKFVSGVPTLYSKETEQVNTFTEIPLFQVSKVASEITPEVWSPNTWPSRQKQSQDGISRKGLVSESASSYQPVHSWRDEDSTKRGNYQTSTHDVAQPNRNTNLWKNQRLDRSDLYSPRAGLRPETKAQGTSLSRFENYHNEYNDSHTIPYSSQTRERNQYGDSAFYESSGSFRPVVNDQTKLNKKIGQSSILATNGNHRSPAKGLSNRWTREGWSAFSPDNEEVENWYQDNRFGVDKYKKRPDRDFSSTNNNVKQITKMALAPREFEQAPRYSQKTDIKTVAPTMCFGIAADLKAKKDRGGLLFEKRKQRVDKFILEGNSEKFTPPASRLDSILSQPARQGRNPWEEDALYVDPTYSQGPIWKDQQNYNHAPAYRASTPQPVPYSRSSLKYETPQVSKSLNFNRTAQGWAGGCENPVVERQRHMSPNRDADPMTPYSYVSKQQTIKQRVKALEETPEPRPASRLLVQDNEDWGRQETSWQPKRYDSQAWPDLSQADYAEDYSLPHTKSWQTENAHSQRSEKKVEYNYSLADDVSGARSYSSPAYRQPIIPGTDL